MKILLVDNVIDGHHLLYLKEIQKTLSSSHEVICLLPNHTMIDDYIVLDDKYITLRNFNTYLSFTNYISKICIENNIDIVHFLYGDIFYRFFGINLNKIQNKSKILITFHRIKHSFLRRISYKLIFSSISYGIVHTEEITNELTKYLDNVIHIEYPNFINRIPENKNILLEKYNLKKKNQK